MPVFARTVEGRSCHHHIAVVVNPFSLGPRTVLQVVPSGLFRRYSCSGRGLSSAAVVSMGAHWCVPSRQIAPLGSTGRSHHRDRASRPPEP